MLNMVVLVLLSFPSCGFSSPESALIRKKTSSELKPSVLYYHSEQLNCADKRARDTLYTLSKAHFYIPQQRDDESIYIDRTETISCDGRNFVKQDFSQRHGLQEPVPFPCSRHRSCLRT